jgi:hypothetical protein
MFWTRKIFTDPFPDPRPTYLFLVYSWRGRQGGQAAAGTAQESPLPGTAGSFQLEMAPQLELAKHELSSRD